MQDSHARKQVQPEYARPGTYDVPMFPVRAAAVCGGIPLVCGCAIYAGWIVTRREDFAVLGLMNIGAGIIFFIIGGVCLLSHLTDLRMWHDRPLQRFFRTSWIAILLLLVNFPTAAVMVWSLDWVEQTFPVARPPSVNTAD